MNRTPLIKWEDYLQRSIPEGHRIGKEVMLIESYDTPLHVREPFRVMLTMVHILKKGHCRISINMLEYEVKAPAMIVYLAGGILEYRETSRDALFDCIIYSGDFFNTFLDGPVDRAKLQLSMLQRPVVQIDRPWGDGLAYYFHFMQAIVQDATNPFRLDAARCLTQTVFYTYGYRTHRLEERKVTRKYALSDDFIKLLQEHYTREREVGYYAEKLCVTPKYLSKVLRETTGKTASTWIDEFVITACKVLLRTEGMTLSQVAEEMNFDDNALFGKYFKRVTGIPPGQYHKQK